MSAVMSGGRGGAVTGVQEMGEPAVSPTESTRNSRLLRLAWVEAEKHKWIESEKAGRDLGEDAIRDWSRRYWWRWCRERWIEHLSGVRFWEELDQKDFGLLDRNFHSNVQMVALVVQRIKAGGENLDIVQWVLNNGENLKDAIEILQLLDINSRRITFWP